MNLIIDIGNTCTKLVAFDGLEPVEERRMDTGDLSLLEGFCAQYPFRRGILSSVVSLSEELQRQLFSLPFPLMQLVPGVTPVPLVNDYATPSTLGADRLAAAIGAYCQHEGHEVLVIDIGTCITYDFVDSRGHYLGGNISPGPTIRFNALHQFTSSLPLVERRGDTPLMGHSTETAIRSGVLRGIEYEIDGYIRDFLLNYPNLYVYLTGGVHLNLHISEKKCIFADDFIVPKGLNRVLLYNEERKINS